MQTSRKGAFTLALIIALALPAVAVAQGHPLLLQINDQLAALGENVRVAYAEYVTTGDGPEFGRTIFASNRGNKQLSADWVPGDPNRYGVNDIFWTIDQVDGSADLPLADVNAAIDRGMATWQDVECSTIPLVKIPDFGIDFGYVQFLLGYGGIEGWLADLTHAGWLPGSFFDAVTPGGSNFILGVTFTLIWIDENGDPVDQDRNRKDDVAFREIYYNDAFAWNIDATFDVETIALHEAGHGLSQAHFGDIFRDGAGGLHFAPRAVMNAAYSGVQQELTGTDNAGHCSNWAQWPKR